MARSVATIMALALDQELQAHGIFSLGRADCEAIITRVIERTSAIGASLSKAPQQSSHSEAGQEK